MFNTYTYNLRPYNFVKPSSSTFTGEFEYNGYSMPSSVFRLGRIFGIQDDNEIDAREYDIANAHGRGLSNYFFKSKRITVEGIMEANTVAGLDEAKDSLVNALREHNKTLKFLKASGGVVYTTAYCRDRSFSDNPRHLTFTPVTIEFVTLEPFFYTVNTNEAAFEGQSSDFSSTVQNPYGSFKALPQITIAFQTGLSSVTTVEVTLNGKTITVNENISDSDSLVIDCKEQDVLINDIGGKDYTGEFPDLEVGTNPIDVSIDGTWTADIYVTRPYTYV